MVDKINGQKYYEYAKINQEKRKSVDTPEFHLDPEKQGVIYEKSEEKKKSSKTEAKQESSGTSEIGAQAGVKVEISHQGREKVQQREKRTDFSKQIRRLAETAVAFLKSLWDRIWNEPATEEKVEFPEILEERMEQAQEEEAYSPAEAIPGEYLLPGEVSMEQPAYTREEIRAIFRRGNRKEIESFLSDNGQRHLVKNSDLLTQYDKNGMIIGVNRPDKELILHGNKNEIKL